LHLLPPKSAHEDARSGRVALGVRSALALGVTLACLLAGCPSEPLSAGAGAGGSGTGASTAGAGGTGTGGTGGDAGVEPPDAGADGASIVVDTQTTLGAKPAAFALGIQAGNFKPPKDALVAAAKVTPGIWKDYIGFGDAFDSKLLTPPTSDQWNAFDQLMGQKATTLKVAADAGYKVEIHLDGMPHWLSSCPDNELAFLNFPGMKRWSQCPPSDYGQYEELLRRMAAAFAAKGLHPFYSSGNEPQWEVIGTEADYLAIYHHAAVGIRKGDPLAKVGASPTAGS
jgi:hypothetical protein